MGHYKHNGDGDLSLISGKGRAEYGASTVRKVTVTFTVPGNNGAAGQDITFSTPMPDADYLVSNLVITDANDSHVIFDVCNKTANGFRLYATNEYNRELTFTVEVYAFKLYTDTEYGNILDAMPSNASASNKLVTESEITVIKSGTITDTVNTNGYLNTTLPRSVNVISVISQNNSQTARVVVSDDGVKYAIQILNGTSNTPVTSGTATVIYYYI